MDIYLNNSNFYKKHVVVYRVPVKKQLKEMGFYVVE